MGVGVGALIVVLVGITVGEFVGGVPPVVSTTDTSSMRIAPDRSVPEHSNTEVASLAVAVKLNSK